MEKRAMKIALGYIVLIIPFVLLIFGVRPDFDEMNPQISLGNPTLLFSLIAGFTTFVGSAILRFENHKKIISTINMTISGISLILFGILFLR